MTKGEPGYRDAASARAEGETRSSSGVGCTLLGAALIIAVVGAVGFPVARSAWNEHRRSAADEALRAFLDDDETAAALAAADALVCPALPAEVAHHDDEHMRVEQQRFGGSPAADARGVIASTGRRRRVDVAFAALDDTRIARTESEVAWIAFVDRHRLRGAYSYGPVSVDVEHVEVRLVSRDGAPIAAVTLQALPPTQTSTQGRYYTLDAAEVAAAITSALAPR